MNACMQAKLDFSIFILQFNFFNAFVSFERFDVSENARFCQGTAFLLGQGWADGLLGGLFPITSGLLPSGPRHFPLF